jgi:ribonuclease D
MVKYPYTLHPPILVSTVEALDEAILRLTNEPVVAVDTESNSLYAYVERVCLLQFSVPGTDYLIDPLAIGDLSPLGAFFADPRIEKVFHAAEYDVMVLRRDYQFEFANLFDTMIASRVVGWSRYGLGSLLRDHFGVLTDKRMQRTNWGKRPLSPEQLVYAQLDTHFLLALRQKLLDELVAQGRVEEARLAFGRVAQSEWTEKGFDPEAFWNIKGATSLDDTGLAVLRALYIYRDQRAQALDRPPFKVLGDQVLLDLGRDRPRSLAELGRMKGIPRRLPTKELQRILDVIEQGLGDPLPSRKKRERRSKPDQAVLNRYGALKEWRKERARNRGVEPDVVLSNRTMRALARRNPTSPEDLRATGLLSDWERQQYGHEIVALLRRHKRIGSE